MVSHPLIIYGGTFDPVHYGHLRTALELSELFSSGAEVRMVPCGDPKHREPPAANGQHRLAMLRQAVSDIACLQADDREVIRPGATYTIDTLTHIRQQIGQRPLIFVMGGDAFLGFTKWHRWLEIIDLAHIMVVKRPTWSISGQGELKGFYQQHLTRDLTELTRLPSGKLGECQPTQLDISGTAIRRLLEAGHLPKFLLPDAVLNYIVQQRLYGVQTLPTVGS